ncbi:MAG: SDR family oxidoreductase [Chromatiales bacterium]|nr:SDR family oxidoreductase [Chromatiales bacterium]
MKNKIIFGCGYVGQRVADELQQQDEVVIGVVRSAASAAVLEQAGIKALQLDLDQPLPTGFSAADLPLQEAELFYFAPPPGKGVSDTRVRNLIAAFARLGAPRRIVYLSTTGVYGDCQGAWIDESHPVNPVVDRARRRWDAEQAFREWRQQSGAELVTLRVAGIYGPGKLPLERLAKGLPMVRESEAPYTNRIHSADLVQVCIAAMRRGVDGEVYNVSDGQPGTMTDYFKRVAARAELPAPAEISLAEGAQQLSAGMMSYMRESRRLRNDKMLRELEIELLYPDLESGLEASFD